VYQYVPTGVIVVYVVPTLRCFVGQLPTALVKLLLVYAKTHAQVTVKRIAHVDQLMRFASKTLITVLIMLMQEAALALALMKEIILALVDRISRYAQTQPIVQFQLILLDFVKQFVEVICPITVPVGPLTLIVLRLHTVILLTVNAYSLAPKMEMVAVFVENRRNPSVALARLARTLLLTQENALMLVRVVFLKTAHVAKQQKPFVQMLHSVRILLLNLVLAFPSVPK